ncbi:MAG: hypothetical protein IKQ89_02720, partial [Muribaculaceae bacterium]|nr:hypothetical protein [Muribaculaceae bacterium]
PGVVASDYGTVVCRVGLELLLAKIEIFLRFWQGIFKIACQNRTLFGGWGLLNPNRSSDWYYVIFFIPNYTITVLSWRLAATEISP